MQMNVQISFASPRIKPFDPYGDQNPKIGVYSGYLDHLKSCFIWPNNGWGQNQWMLPLEKGLGHRDGMSTTPLDVLEPKFPSA